MTRMKMRRFILNRTEDISGMSGTGIVAEGVVFDDGTCALRWLTMRRSTVIFDNVSDLIAIHGHGGTTQLQYLDHHSRTTDKS